MKSDLPRFVSDGATPPEGGACSDKPTRWWFPEPGLRNSINTARAIKICRECSVKQECLDYSLPYEPFGIWGGLNEQQRLMIRINKQIPTAYRTHAGLRPTRSKRMSRVQTHR